VNGYHCFEGGRITNSFYFYQPHRIILYTAAVKAWSGQLTANFPVYNTTQSILKLIHWKERDLSVLFQKIITAEI